MLLMLAIIIALKRGRSSLLQTTRREPPSTNHQGHVLAHHLVVTTVSLADDNPKELCRARVIRSRCYRVGDGCHPTSDRRIGRETKSKEHTSELQTLMRISY